MKKTEPIFIFSLPRSGSTLLQRLISQNSEIYSISEPWLLLPFFYSLREGGSYTEYGHKLLVKSIKNLYGHLPSGVEDYKSEISLFYMRICNKICGKKYRYFVDKTPRYHLIVEDIISTFSDAKFIFLWRNPIAIISSIIDTWGNNKWNLYRYYIDLYDGLYNIVTAYEKYEQLSISLKYEDLVSNSEKEMRKICKYLNIEIEPSMIETNKCTSHLSILGDPTGVNRYNSVSNMSLEKWKRNMNSRIRKKWCKKYIKDVGDHRLMVMGYDYNKIISDINDLRLEKKNDFSDMIRMLYGGAYNFFEIEVLRDKINSISKGHLLKSHR